MTYMHTQKHIHKHTNTHTHTHTHKGPMGPPGRTGNEDVMLSEAIARLKDFTRYQQE